MRKTSAFSELRLCGGRPSLALVAYSPLVFGLELVPAGCSVRRRTSDGFDGSDIL